MRGHGAAVPKALAAVVLLSAVARAADPAAVCTAGKLLAATKKLTAKAKCHAAAVRKLAAVDPGCLDKAEVKFVAKFAALETHGGCVTTGDAASVEGLVEDALAALLAALPASTTTTSTSTTTTTSLPPPMCGNAIREVGEQCDGGNLCTASCTLTGLAFGCCEFPNDHVPACLAADGFSLNFNMYSYCLAQGSMQNVTGGICGASGDCEIVAIDPVPLCCQAAGSCADTVASSSAGLWQFYNGCEGLTSFSSHTVVAATCVAGVCTPS